MAVKTLPPRERRRARDKDRASRQAWRQQPGRNHPVFRQAPDAYPRIDPRIRARRIAVRREGSRRRLTRLVRVLMVVGVAAAGWLLTRSPLLNVDRIEVTGTAHTSADEVRAVSGIRQGVAMTDANLSRARERVEQLPWVEEVKISRRWPATIRAEITERVAVAAVDASPVDARAGFWLVDADGRLLEQVVTPPDLRGKATGASAEGGGNIAGLTDVVAPDGAVVGDRLRGVRGLLAVARVLPGDLRARVAAVARSETRGEVELRLVDGGRVALGSTDNLESKVLAAVTVLTQVDTGCGPVLDVRVPRAPALTRGTRCA